jgi:hypothetical protein
MTDYRYYGLLIAVAIVLLILWRRLKYGGWPGYEDYVALITSIVGILGGTTIGIVFLFTKPPAIDLLPSQSLLLVGLFTPIVMYSYTFPRIRALLFPPQIAEKPPTDEQDSKLIEQPGIPRPE